MENEQEGINLETINPENEDVIILPDVDDVDNTEENVAINQEDSQNNEVDNIEQEKESLKKGVNKERQRRKEAERKNRELEERIKALEEATKKEQKSTYDTLVESGVDETIAKSISSAIDSKDTNTNKLEKEIADLRFKNSLNEKSREEGFEDILDYADEIKDLVNKGLTIEQSYHAVSYDKPSLNTKSEIQRKLEAKIQNNNARREILGNINSNVGIANKTNKIKVSAEEKAVAVAAGISVEEYVAMRDIESVKDYNQYKSRKKQ